MKLSLLIAITCFLFASDALTHSGRTNSEGCHNNRKTGGYHCHNGGSSSYRKRIRTAKPIPPVKYTYPSTSRRTASAKRTNTVKLSRDKIIKIQIHLNRLGYNAGDENGIMNTKTKKAISHFQVDADLPINGKPSNSLLGFLQVWKDRYKVSRQ